MGRFDSLKELGGLWLSKQKRRLQGKPQTLVDSGGSGISSYTFSEQAHGRDALKEIKEMREDGGVIATLVHSKALMTFGGGFEIDAEPEIVEWVNENLPTLEEKVLEMGEDALWYPYSLGEVVETRGGDISHIEGIEPWTMQPQTDETGEIEYWEQQITRHETTRFETDEIGSLVLNKSCARDKTGISDVLRAKEEIQHYLDIERMVQKSAETAAVPHNHWIVGRENGAPLDDNDLRRVRSLVERLEGDTQVITGPDVKHDRIEADDYDFEGLIAHKLRQVAIALGVPLEMVASGDQGLGAGNESDMRMRVFQKDARAYQRSFASQFENEFLLPILNQYSPFNVGKTDVSLNFKDPIERDDRAEQIQNIGEDMTVNERREAYDLEPLEGDIGESYATARDETTEDSDPDVGGLFGEAVDDSVDSALEERGLQDIEDIDTVPPQGVQDAAQKALDWKEETGNPNDCGTQTGWTRASQLANGESLSEDTINRMVSFFARHDEGGDSQPKEDCSRMMWAAWGGDPGKRWAESKQAEFENAREAQEGDTGFSHDLSDYPEWERCMLEAWESTVATEDTDRQLLQSSTDVPEFVKERIRGSIRDGNVFSDIDGVGGDMMQLREYLTESLTSDGGWTIDGVADQLMQLEGVDSRDKAETIARTETASVLNSAREDGYQEQGLAEDSKFYWTGSLDGRETAACAWLIAGDSAANDALPQGKSWQGESFGGTNPFKGGEPVSLERLKELIELAAEGDPELSDNMARPENFTVHINERKTFARMPGT